MAMRLDVRISEQFKLTRNKSQAFIKDGLVSINGNIVSKPSFEIKGDETIILREEKKIHWVSRSAGKLDGFLEELRMKNCELRIIGANCLDVGSSTWGFTQVLLEHGAAHVDAVDVGTDQLDTILRSDPRVTSYEQTDIRKFKSEKIYDIIVCDASFISLTEILPSILVFSGNETKIILLWKPQFEVGKENLRKTGVPKNEKIVLEFQKQWEKFLSENNCKILQKEKSSVMGEAGNQEWLYRIKKEK
jgi:23S rRNA (cytidine1920-2'-O)/16S rRNA (cytidine1409-2'-O)-methyltransferase